MLRILEKAETASMCLVLWVLFGVVGLQFFTRYILNDSLGWTEEIARMLLVVLTYVGAVVCARNRSHIRVDLLLEYLNEGNRKRLITIFDLISVAFFAFLCWTAGKFALTTRLRMSSIDLPKSIIFWVCAAALGLMALHFLMHFIRELKQAPSTPDNQGGA